MKKYYLAIFMAVVFVNYSHVLRAEIDLKTPAWEKVEVLGKENSYAFLFFGDDKTENGKKMQATLEEMKQGLTGKKADIIKITPDDAQEKKLTDLFNLRENPTVMIIAPNEAITGYFAGTVDKGILTGCLVSSKEADLIKNLQEKRVVFLCFRRDTEPDFAAIKTSLESVANNFKGAVNVIYVSRNDEKEKELREKFEISSEAPTVFIILPPGKAAAKLEGADITKTNLMRVLLSACGGGGCGSGCK